MAVVELAIPARQAYLSLVRLVVDASVGALAPGLGSARLDDLKLAVSEACSNAIEAHELAPSPSSSSDPVVIRCELDHNRVTVEVADHGGGFDPNGVAHLPAATDPGRLDHESGLGIPLMRTLADNLAFVPDRDGTTVRLTVYRAE
jgi:anti-sigma regulatory factor (Ser/Thr protein kinase)